VRERERERERERDNERERERERVNDNVVDVYWIIVMSQLDHSQVTTGS